MKERDILYKEIYMYPSTYFFLPFVIFSDYTAVVLENDIISH